MKKLFLLLFPLAVQAQAPKSIVVEHFTNSRCSICADQNPAFYQNLANHPEVKHIAYYPTSPYVNCLLAQHNPTESDARTQYYGLYGSTPKIAIQGVPVSNSPNPFPNPNLYDSYQGQTSAFALKVVQTKELDTIRIRIVLKTVAPHFFNFLRLYAAVAEDTVFYSSPNGESLHHDVFRKSFFGADGLTITPAPNTGDSVVFESKIGKHPTWNFSRIFSYAIVQNTSTKALVQSDFADPSAGTVAGIQDLKTHESDILLYPNPSFSGFRVDTQSDNNISIKIYSSTGSLLISYPNGQQTELGKSLPPGMYWIYLQTKNGMKALKWLKQ